MKRRFMLFVFIPVLALVSCPLPNDPSDTISGVYDEFVKKAVFSGPTATIGFTGLNGNDIYLVKVNTSDNAVSAGNTGGVLALPAGIQSISGGIDMTEKKLPRRGHPAADEFNANPPPIIEEGPLLSRAVFASPSVGTTRSFWVESFFGSGSFVQKTATLRAAGTYGNIWVMNENFSPPSAKNRITTAQAQTLAQKFDVIYPAATSILGYEYGGGPGGNGGRDGDVRVQILVYDIVDAGGNVQAAGYFWGKDYYPRFQIPYSNEAEIFYIDASQVNDVPDYIYSTLVHEFQHMIHFNEKNIKRGLPSVTWYNEMLSMMAEDIIAPLIGVGPDHLYHPIRQEARYFLGSYYQVGITEWVTLGSASYAKGFAFGAYLMRNFGGADLLKNILSNNYVDTASITAALNAYSRGMTFDQALARFGEAMVFSGSQMPDGVLSFDKTVTRRINGRTYTATGFDIWKMLRSDNTGTGPFIFNLNQNPAAMRPHSITVHLDAAWKNKSGDFSVTLQRPSNLNIELYLMAR